MEVNSTWLITSELANQRTRKVLFTCVVYTNKEYPPKYYQGMGIFIPGEQRNTEYLKLKYSPSTPDDRSAVRLIFRLYQHTAFFSKLVTRPILQVSMSLSGSELLNVQMNAV